MKTKFKLQCKCKRQILLVIIVDNSIPIYYRVIKKDRLIINDCIGMTITGGQDLNVNFKFYL